MSYKAQLVVRARGKEGAGIIETVKEMANEEGKTYSEMAVELLGRGLNTDGEVAPSPMVEKKEQSAPIEKSEPVVIVEERVKEPVRPVKKRSTHPRAPLPAEEAGPAVDPELPPVEILRHYLDQREELGERAAARVLVDFFAAAGVGPGGKLKKLLQKELTGEEFETLMEPIKETEEYSSYMSRALGEPSPYSEVR